MVECYTLNGNVNSYSNKYWYSTNPHTVNYVPLNDLEVRVWCAQNQSAHVYQKNNKFIPLHMVNSDKITHRITKRLHRYFMHKNVIAHSTNFSATVMEKVFGKYITDTL